MDHDKIINPINNGFVLITVILIFNSRKILKTKSSNYHSSQYANTFKIN